MAIVVNGERVDQEAVKQEADRMRQAYERAFADKPEAEREQGLSEWARENAVEQVLLRQAAKADPRPVPPEEFEQAIQQATRGQPVPEGAEGDALRADVELHLRINRLMEEACKDLPPPSDEAVRRYYEEHLQEFKVPERMHAAHIVKHVTPAAPPEVAEAALLEVRKELDAGADFAEAAARHSDCPENGGDLGWFPRGQMVEEFEHTVFKMRAGQVSNVFATRFGFHIVKVLERKPAGPASLEEVQEHIRERLSGEARNDAVGRFLDGLREKATVEEVA